MVPQIIVLEPRFGALFRASNPYSPSTLATYYCCRGVFRLALLGIIFVLQSFYSSFSSVLVPVSTFQSSINASTFNSPALAYRRARKAPGRAAHLQSPWQPHRILRQYWANIFNPIHTICARIKSSYMSGAPGSVSPVAYTPGASRPYLKQK